VDGGGPQGGLIRDPVGNLYGTTSGGGAHVYGTVFKLDTAGKETVLHSFALPRIARTEKSPLRFGHGHKRKSIWHYWGGRRTGAHGFGTVFKLTATGKETVLHSFAGPPTDGVEPVGGMLMDAKENLYGTTLGGGAGKFGTVFRLASNGSETVLHGFDAVNGAAPRGSLIMDAMGNLYGTASASIGCGLAVDHRASYVVQDT